MSNRLEGTLTIAITQSIDPDHYVQSEYGLIPARDWFEYELERIPNTTIEKDGLGRWFLIRRGLIRNLYKNDKKNMWVE